jgi:hemerythrin-like domain-containing protein
MCEYCGCRRIPEIARLGEEHDTITELADDADASRPDASTRNAALRRLREALVPHAEREERGVFTEARHAGLTGYYIEDLEDDHRRFKEALDHPESLDDATLETLLKDLDRHIAIEEYDLFPAAAKHLSDEQWESIDSMDTESGTT